MISKAVVRVTVAVAALATTMPTPARAWGDDGHYIVGHIANRYMTPRAQVAVTELLGNGRVVSSRPVPVWADAIKRSARYRAIYPDNDRYHYINLRVDQEMPPLNGSGASVPANVYEAVSRFTRDMTSPDLPEERRREAVFFIVHFIGDLHQPLHCGDLDDHGGNKRMVRLAVADNPHDEVKLHAFWDTQLVREVAQGLAPEDTARRLGDALSAQQVSALQQGDVAAWVRESRELAKDEAYGRAGIRGDDGVAPRPPVRLTAEYVAHGRRVVALQLQRAGVRLAKVLNQAFEDE